MTKVAYFNRTRTPLAVALASGVSVSLPPKGWLEVEPGQDSSESIIAAVSRGDLVRKEIHVKTVVVPPGPGAVEQINAAMVAPVEVVELQAGTYEATEISSPDVSGELPPTEEARSSRRKR